MCWRIGQLDKTMAVLIWRLVKASIKSPLGVAAVLWIDGEFCELFFASTSVYFWFGAKNRRFIHQSWLINSLKGSLLINFHFDCLSLPLFRKQLEGDEYFFSGIILIFSNICDFTRRIFWRASRTTRYVNFDFTLFLSTLVPCQSFCHLKPPP